MSKLGYSVDEVKKYVHEENSFVSVLYNKLLEESNTRNALQGGVGRCSNSLSGKSNI